MDSQKLLKALLLSSSSLAGEIANEVASVFSARKKREEESHLVRNIILGGLAGGLVAGSLAFLYAQKSGKSLISGLSHLAKPVKKEIAKVTRKSSQKRKTLKQGEPHVKARGKSPINKIKFG